MSKPPFRLWQNPLCPACAALLDGASGLGHDSSPMAGDLTVCAYCRALLQYTEGLGLRLAPEEELSPEERRQLEYLRTRLAELRPRIRGRPA
jgi:hypothetical protein